MVVSAVGGWNVVVCVVDVGGVAARAVIEREAATHEMASKPTFAIRADHPGGFSPADLRWIDAPRALTSTFGACQGPVTR